MHVIDVSLTKYGLLTYIFIALTIFLFLMAWIPGASTMIYGNIGLLFCILPIITFILAAVFAYLDEVKKEKVALELAHKNYHAQYTQQQIPIQQTPKVPQPQRSPRSQEGQTKRKSQLSKQQPRSKIHPNKTKKASVPPKKPKKIQPPPPPPPPT
jgi:uncharacterized membrane protein